jgi:hypothetical protein
MSEALVAHENVIPPDAPRSTLICDGQKPAEVPAGACSGRRWTRGQLLAIESHGTVMARIDRTDYAPTTGAIEAPRPSPAELLEWLGRFESAGVEIVHLSLPLFAALARAAQGNDLEQALPHGIPEKLL